MLNNIILVGRVTQQPTPQAKTLTIATERSYKNTNTNTYDTDFFNIALSDGMLETAIDYLKEGDLVGVKGHLETTTNYKSNEKEIKIICDRLTFLSQSRSANNMGKGEI